MNHLLIVDDHAIWRRGLRNLLEAEMPDVSVFEAHDSGEALAQLAMLSWDLVVLDIGIPGRNGLEVLEEMRRLQVSAPVLVLSALAEEEFAMRAFQLGASGYLNKLTAFDELITAVRRILDGGKYVTASLAEKLVTKIGGGLRGAPHELLSNRELQVLRLIAVGRTLKEISTQIGVSEKTVATYRARISEKTGLSTKVEMARYSLQHKLVD